jgi:predicted DNA-binding transcriptional regulator AlpA
MLPSPEYLGSRAVRRRYGDISDMSLWRWLHDEKLNFPKPTIIQKRRYWRIAELEAWERARAARAMGTAA